MPAASRSSGFSLINWRTARRVSEQLAFPGSLKKGYRQLQIKTSCNQGKKSRSSLDRGFATGVIRRVMKEKPLSSGWFDRLATLLDLNKARGRARKCACLTITRRNLKKVAIVPPPL
jgi:hypothetical protein